MPDIFHNGPIEKADLEILKYLCQIRVKDRIQHLAPILSDLL